MTHREIVQEALAMVARMTLDQIARYLDVDIIEAKNALNRIGICAPSGDEEVIITSHDLKRAANNVAAHRAGWATAASIASGGDRIV
jgi:hypothetical protein